MNNSNIGCLLVVAAHPDDEVLGCGATVHKLVSNGWQAHLVILSAGVGGRYASDTAVSDEVQQAQTILGEQMRRAASAIGYHDIHTFDYPDNRMDVISRMDIVLSLQPIIARVKPNLVFTHHPGDYNWDHTITFDSVMMAARCNPPDFSPSEIRTFEVLSSTERASQDATRIFCPNLYVDVANSIDMKKLALKYYQSEYHPYPHPRSIEAIEYLARRRGNEVGLEYAEAFHIIRKVER